MTDDEHDAIEGPGFRLFADVEGACLELSPFMTHGVDVDAPWAVWSAVLAKEHDDPTHFHVLNVHWPSSSMSTSCLVHINAHSLRIHTNTPPVTGESLVVAAVPLPCLPPPVILEIGITRELRDAIRILARRFGVDSSPSARPAR